MTLAPLSSVTITWIWAIDPYRGLQSAAGAATVAISPGLALVGLTI